MFKLNIARHVSRSTPPFWRTLFTLAWLESLLQPLGWLNDQFLLWVAQKRIEMQYTGQTIMLEKALNDIFDPVLRRIYIVHSTEVVEYDYFRSEVQPPDFDYNRAEAAPARYNWFTQEIESLQVDGFIVVLPAEVSTLEDRVKGFIRRYRIANIHYALTYIA